MNKEQLKEILKDFENNAITKHQAYELILILLEGNNTVYSVVNTKTGIDHGLFSTKQKARKYTSNSTEYLIKELEVK